MKRPHRRAHFLIWLLVAPAIMLAAIWIWITRPETPFTKLPPDIEDISTAAEQL